MTPAAGEYYVWVSVLFSEPKIPQSFQAVAGDSLTKAFQCSSASRKFLNPSARRCCSTSWSPPFQCSSASRKFLNPGSRSRYAAPYRQVSVLFSEPKIPQSTLHARARHAAAIVSVLFSEPKIPQSARVVYCARR